MKHRAPQMELPGAQEAFNLAGQCQHTPQGVKTAPAKPQEQPALFPEDCRKEENSQKARSWGAQFNPPTRGELAFDGEVSSTEARI